MADIYNAICSSASTAESIWFGCILDTKAQEEFKAYWEQQCKDNKDGIDPYNDLFCNLLEENSKANPKYQRKSGDWLNWVLI